MGVFPRLLFFLGCFFSTSALAEGNTVYNCPLAEGLLHRLLKHRIDTDDLRSVQLINPDTPFSPWMLRRPLWLNEMQDGTLLGMGKIEIQGLNYYVASPQVDESKLVGGFLDLVEFEPPQLLPDNVIGHALSYTTAKGDPVTLWAVDYDRIDRFLKAGKLPKPMHHFISEMKAFISKRLKTSGFSDEIAKLAEASTEKALPGSVVFLQTKQGLARMTRKGIELEYDVAIKNPGFLLPKEMRNLPKSPPLIFKTDPFKRFEPNSTVIAFMSDTPAKKLPCEVETPGLVLPRTPGKKTVELGRLQAAPGAHAAYEPAPRQMLTIFQSLRKDPQVGDIVIHVADQARLKYYLKYDPTLLSNLVWPKVFTNQGPWIFRIDLDAWEAELLRKNFR